MINLYTKEGCGICKMVKTKLAAKNIEYNEIHDIQPLIKLGIASLPALQLEDGTFITTPIKINNWIKQQ